MHFFHLLECWDSEPDNRPLMHEVVERLRAIISQSNVTVHQQQNDNVVEKPSLDSVENSSYEGSSLEFNFYNMSINKMESTMANKNISSEKNLSKIVSEIIAFISKMLNEGTLFKLLKGKTLDYFSNRNINSKEIFNWLLNNQNDVDSIFLLGFFHFCGIETSINYKHSFSLFINLSEQNHTLAQYFAGKCYFYEWGATKNEKLAFEYFEKAANKDCAAGQMNLGYYYVKGIGVENDSKMAAKWYEKAANNGNI